jgi:hypothetical protein
LRAWADGILDLDSWAGRWERVLKIGPYAPGALDTYSRGVSGFKIVGYYDDNSGDTYGFLAVPMFSLTAAAVGTQIHLTVSGYPVAGIVQTATNLQKWVCVYTNTPPFIFTDSAALFPLRFHRATVSQ